MSPLAVSNELNHVEKAAAILVAMGRERAAKLLKYFKGGELKRLVDAAHSLESISQSDLEDLVDEFENEFARGGGLLDSAETIDSIISEAFSPEEFKQLLEPAIVESSEPEGPSIWKIMDDMDVPEISEFLTDEHPVVCALILSKLSPRNAADIVATFDREKRKHILKHMLSMGDPSTIVLRFIESSLRERFGAPTGGAAVQVGRVRVANVLNELDRPNMEEVFDDLSNDSDPDNIAAVKSLLFRFEDVIHLDQTARSILFDGIETEVATLALQGADSELTEAVLSSVGQRTRRMMESELAADMPVNEDAVSQARRNISSTAIRLATEDRIVLPSAQDEAA